MEVRIALNVIETAFDGVPRPETSLAQFRLTDEKGMSGEITDDEWDAAGILRIDSRWQDLPDIELERQTGLLSHMGAEEFRYYLPAYMRYSLSHIEKSWLENPTLGSTVFALTFLDRTGPMAGYHLSQFELLDGPQRNAIAAFLRCVIEHADERERFDARRALGYWDIEGLWEE